MPKNALILWIAAFLPACASATGGTGSSPAVTHVTRVYATGETRAGSVELKADVYAPTGRQCRGAIVLVHGGSYVSGARDLQENRDYGTSLAARGYLAAAISYRLLKDAPAIGGWNATYAEAIRISDDPLLEYAISLHGKEWPLAAAAAAADVSDAIAWLREQADEHDCSPDNLAVFGASAGAIASIAAAYAADDYGGEPIDVAAVISLRGASLPHSENATRFRSDDPPLMILHGAADDRIPLERARAMFDAVAGAGLPVQFFVAPDFGHELGGAELFAMRTPDGASVLDHMTTFLDAAFAREPASIGVVRDTVRP